jgi:hypothetical protein
MNNQTALLAAAVGVVVIAAFVFALARRRRTAHLKERFGSEYERMVAADGKSAEANLAEREKRVDGLQIHPVPPELREGFANAWSADQARFVDEPEAAVAEADALVQKVMEARGYPTGSVDQRGSDISVDHPGVMESYRAAHELALKRERGEASTEDLRQAFVHYRALFDELLEVPRLTVVQQA